MADDKNLKPTDEETVAEGASEKTTRLPVKKPPTIVFVVIAVIVGLLLAGGIAYFVATKLVATGPREVGGGGGGGNSSYHEDPGVFVKLGDAKDGILVNVGGIKGGHFLKAGIVIELNPNRKANVKDGKINPIAETKMLDTTLHILRSEPMDSFDAMKQDELKDKIKAEVNRALGEGAVYSVYITSFVLQ